MVDSTCGEVFHVEYHRVVQQAIETGGSDDTVTSQEVALLRERFVARQDYAPDFVAPRDHFRQVVRAGLVERHVAYFINDQKRHLAQGFEARTQRMIRRSGKDSHDG